MFFCFQGEIERFVEFTRNWSLLGKKLYSQIKQDVETPVAYREVHSDIVAQITRIELCNGKYCSIVRILQNRETSFEESSEVSHVVTLTRDRGECDLPQRAALFGNLANTGVVESTGDIVLMKQSTCNLFYFLLGDRVFCWILY